MRLFLIYSFICICATYRIPQKSNSIRISTNRCIQNDDSNYNTPVIIPYNTPVIIPYRKEDEGDVMPTDLFGVRPIGIVRSPYIKRLGTPKQATILSEGKLQLGTIEIFEEYRECLDQLETFDYIWLITYMHLNSGFKGKIKPMPNVSLQEKSGQSAGLSSESVGLFCSR